MHNITKTSADEKEPIRRNAAIEQIHHGTRVPGANERNLPRLFVHLSTISIKPR